MSEPLPRLRMNLDFMPSPVPERPGMLIRDPYQFSDATLIIPPALVQCLQLFDGQHTELDLRQALVRITGDLQIGEVQQHLVETLSSVGFLENEAYKRLKSERQEQFAQAPAREPAHAGGAYPGELEPLRATLGRYMNGALAAGPKQALLGIAAPHVSPEGGWESYRAAYGLLDAELAERTFVILGTSHYGEPECFGLTRKPFETPFGQAITDVALVNRLEREAAPAVRMEDYCHAVEHSIEFQVVFLQNLFGAGVRILPILCGAFAHSIYGGGKPEDNEKVRRFVGALGELAAQEGDRLFWVLGVDMAHMGRRYGDSFAATADRDRMIAIAEQDHQRIQSISQADAGSFWEQVQQERDPLKWCGSSPIYTFLRAVPQARGQLEHYQQWNIDPLSVVSFAGMSFSAPLYPRAPAAV